MKDPTCLGNKPVLHVIYVLYFVNKYPQLTKNDILFFVYVGQKFYHFKPSHYEVF